MRRLYVLALIALSAVGVLGIMGSAQAAPSDPWVYKSTFGEGAGLQYEQMAVNHATGNLLVLASDGNLHQFDANGEPVKFAALDSPTLPSRGNFVLDNSGSATQGNIYFYSGYFGDFRLYAYRADGSPIGEGAVGPGEYFPLAETWAEGLPSAVGVGPDGNLWFGNETGEISEFTPPSEVTPPFTSLGKKLRLENEGKINYLRFDGIGNLYTGRSGTRRFDADDGSYLGPTGLSESGFPLPMEINPATHEVYLPRRPTTDGAGGAGVQAVGPTSSVPYQALSTDFGLREPRGVTFDPSGQTLYLSEEDKIHVFHREPPSPPHDLTPPSAGQVRSSAGIFSGSMSDGGAAASYRFEYGTDATYGESTPAVQALLNYFSTDAAAQVSGLQPNTTYHVRLVATNSAGTTYGPDGTFKTYPVPPGAGADPCPNALARKQTVAQRLPDCRAYELVSAADTGGYDVESYLAPGQNPFPGFPLARDRVLYATHSGAVPGPWNATNHGPDPYIATRTANGWSTDYKGLPSNLNPEAGSFSSVLGEADPGLTSLAFAGSNLCDPCFTDGGLRTGIPLRLPSGQLVQGMSGSLAGSVPDTAKPEGKVAQYFSGDGKHLVFASEYAFEPGASNTGLTVYDRNLVTSTTQIVSTDQAGNPLTGTVSELGVSANGSRIITATKLGDDAQGNELTHPYMHIGNSPNSVDLAPGASAGVLFAGMTSDGSKVFFTTKDALVAGDTDNSADLYEVAVDGSGNLTLNRITTKNSDACSPVSNANGEHWNTGSATADCSAVAISGGGGVASSTGAIYFLSPEQLDGAKGTLNQPNIYLAQPGGSSSFVATLEPGNPLALDSVKASAVRRTGDFQVTPDGSYVAFPSKLVLAGLRTGGFAGIYRFDAGAGSLACASCDRTGAGEPGVFADAELPPHGLALLSDGRLFFTTKAQLVLNDPNGKKDVYEWSNGEPQLVSAGTGTFDSGLLSASADGTDVFFFTHDSLATGEDRNGAVMRIYDAREGGGYFKLPPTVPCQASDECHGPGTPAPGPSDIKSSGKTTTGNVLVCPKNRVKKRGACVKKPAQRKKKHAKKKKGGAKQRAASTNGKRGGRNA